MTNRQFCLFRFNKVLQFGCVLGQAKGKTELMTTDSPCKRISAKQIELQWNAPLAGELNTTMLEQRWSALQELSTDIDLETIHELLEASIPTPFTELCENFLQNPQDPWEQAALFFGLSEDRLHFARSLSDAQTQFTLRTADEQEQIQAEERIRWRAEHKKERELGWAQQLLAGNRPELQTEEESDWNAFCDRLLKFVCYLENSQEQRYFCDLFSCSFSEPYTTERKIIGALQAAGQNISWGRMLIRRLGMDQEYRGDLNPTPALEAQEEPAEPITQAYTVDSPQTRDYDDAISLHRCSDRLELRLHITQLAPEISKNPQLFAWAEQRISSLYTLKGVYNMLPAEYAEERFALKAGKARKVFTFCWSFDPETFEPSADQESMLCTITTETVHIADNLSYDIVQHSIAAEDGYWSVIHHCAQTLKGIRAEQGMLDLQRSEVMLDIGDPHNIQLLPHKGKNEAHTLVEELAIWANFEAGKRCADAGMAAPYRCQAPYTLLLSEEEQEQKRPLTLKDVHIKPAQISIEPAPHAGLGVRYYMQITSPIRRFIDIIGQNLLLAALQEGSSPYGETQILIWAKSSEEFARTYKRTERNLFEHWCYKYLAQHEGEEFMVEKVRKLRNTCLLRIIDLQMVVETALSPPDEESFPVLVRSVNAEQHQITLALGRCARENELTNPTIPPKNYAC